MVEENGKGPLLYIAVCNGRDRKGRDYESREKKKEMLAYISSFWVEKRQMEW